jgi:hypothetical protein
MMVVELMRPDRIGTPAAASTPRIFITPSTTKENLHAHLRHRRFRLDRLGRRPRTHQCRSPGVLGLARSDASITRELLGWKPTHPGLIEDIEPGHYFI